jgi:uncharacterized iron-regulated membrane protein
MHGNPLAQFFQHPQQVLIRRVNFQIHLWAGILLALYVSVIGITGSVLVFGLEIGRVVDADPWPGLIEQKTAAPLAQVIENVTSAYPRARLISVMTPTRTEPVFIATIQPRRRLKIACHPVTGQLLGEVPVRHSRLDWVYRLHEDLLGGRTGRVVNAVCAMALLLLVLTGLVNWWPGVKHVARALKIDFRRRWKRVNFDIHSAVGFWSFAFLIMWAVSGIYFTWPAWFLAQVDRLSPVVNARPPAVVVERPDEIVPVSFQAMLSKAADLDPGARCQGIIFPYSRRAPLEILMSRSAAFGRDSEDTLYFNPYTGQYISTWQYGVNKTLGDWLIWLEAPLHFGTHWGLAFKCLWALMGLSLPVLAVSGLLMYWNRFLSKRVGRVGIA